MQKNKIRVLICIILSVMYFVLVPINFNHSKESYVVTVIHKESIESGMLFQSHKYLIFTRDSAGDIHVFEDTDWFPENKFNSSDIYAQIEIGKKYLFTVIGHRVTYLSWYQNIIDFKEWP